MVTLSFIPLCRSLSRSSAEARGSLELDVIVDDSDLDAQQIIWKNQWLRWLELGFDVILLREDGR